MRLAAVAVLSLLGAPLARADSQPPKVLVYTAGDDRAGFVGALRIQLTEAEVVDVELPDSPTLADRFAAISVAVAERDASLAVWFERAGDGTYQLYAVGGRRGRGIIEVGRASAGAIGDRELALKVGALVDELIGEPEAIAVLAPAEPRDVEITSPQRIEEIAAIDERLEWAALALAGGAAALSTGDPSAQGGGAVGLGARLRNDVGSLEITLAGHWLADRSLANSAGQASFSEHGGSVRIAALAGVGPFELGPQLAGGIRRLETSAVTTDGVRGGAVSTIPTVELVAAARLPLARHLAVAVGFGAGINLIAEEITIRDEAVVEIGRARLVGELSLVASWPE